MWWYLVVVEYYHRQEKRRGRFAELGLACLACRPLSTSVPKEEKSVPPTWDFVSSVKARTEWCRYAKITQPARHTSTPVSSGSVGSCLHAGKRESRGYCAGSLAVLALFVMPAMMGDGIVRLCTSHIAVKLARTMPIEGRDLHTFQLDHLLLDQRLQLFRSCRPEPLRPFEETPIYYEFPAGSRQALQQPSSHGVAFRGAWQIP